MSEHWFRHYCYGIFRGICVFLINTSVLIKPINPIRTTCLRSARFCAIFDIELIPYRRMSNRNRFLSKIDFVFGWRSQKHLSHPRSITRTQHSMVEMCWMHKKYTKIYNRMTMNDSVSQSVSQSLICIYFCFRFFLFSISVWIWFSLVFRIKLAYCLEFIKNYIARTTYLTTRERASHIVCVCTVWCWMGTPM